MADTPYIDRIQQWEVIDGDTVRCWVDLGYRIQHRIDVRLLGIDTPELRLKAHKEAGQVVAAAVQAWLASHDPEKLRIESVKLDKYAGRTDGDILAGRTRLSAWLTEQGFAKPTSETGKRPNWTPRELAAIAAATPPCGSYPPPTPA